MEEDLKRLEEQAGAWRNEPHLLDPDFEESESNLFSCGTMAAPLEDPAECPAGCWEGDSNLIKPDEDDCYRCPKCSSPLVFKMDEIDDVRLIDDEAPDEPWIVRIAR